MIEHEILFLGLLAEGPKHGYEIKRQLKDDLLPNIGLQIKSIYYPLKKLEVAGLIEQKMGREGHFPEKHVYRITPKGKKRFDKLLESSFLSVERPFFQIDLSYYFLPLVEAGVARRRLKARAGLLRKVRKELALLHQSAKSSTASIILQHDLDLVDAEISATVKVIGQI